MKSFISTVRRFSYLVRKFLLSLLYPKKRLIAYTKFHPIYTSIFEFYAWADYLFFYFDPTLKLTYVERYLLSKTKLVHVDAANAVVYLKNYSTRAVVECEGSPYDLFFTDSRISKIFVESKWAGGKHLANKEVDLLYPAVSIPTPRRKLTRQKLTICAVGYGGMLKGYDVVFRLYKDLKAHFDLQLIIAGTFGHNYEYYPEITKNSYQTFNFPEIASALRSDTNVTFRPFKRSDLFKEVYPNADVYLHLSRLETFGYSILEAMSFGLPIVATHLHAIPEMVVPGKNGFLIDPFEHDINSLEWHNYVFKEAKRYLHQLLSDRELRESFSKHSHELSSQFSLACKQRQLRLAYNGLFESMEP